MRRGGLARRAAEGALRSPLVGRAVRSLARLRGHSLVLVYHRVGPPVRPGAEVVPSVTSSVFRAQVEALASVCDVVPLETVLAGHGGSRPMVALTFDDDLPSHADAALPILRELRMPATFFLSGRALHDLGAYWFQQLEAVATVHGPGRAAGLLGIPATSSADLAAACERDERLRRRVAELAAELAPPEVLDPGAIAELSGAGMTIGFHTLEHGIMPEMDDGALGDAATRGRALLAAAAGQPLRYFAYPHGKADRRTAAVVRRAGFEAAWTGRPQPVHRRADPHLLGRWEPGPLATDELLVKLAVRLHRSSPRPRETVA